MKGWCCHRAKDEIVKASLLATVQTGSQARCPRMQEAAAVHITETRGPFPRMRIDKPSAGKADASLKATEGEI